MKKSIIYLLIINILILACQPNKKDASSKSNQGGNSESFKKEAPEWFNNAMVYEVNVRQMSPSGTLNEFAYHLPRMKEMGIDVVWLMPIYPISKAKRKGKMGSPYAVSDYKAVNPDLGTMADFDKLVDIAHELGIKVMLDFVPNHTGWDHIWMQQHKDWYNTANDTICHPRDNEGKPTDWYDVADLNYDNREMRNEMLDVMKFWVKEHDIDGYRMDVAGFVPNDFWEEVRPALQAIKPILMLSEWEDVPQHFESCFEINYGWEFYHLLNDIAQGKKKASDIDKHYEKVKSKFPADATQLLFITNHDENSWNGTEFKRLGKAKNAMAALTFTFEGVPLIYSGQDVENKKQLNFFDKDVIDFPNLNHKHVAFYKRLIELKHSNTALWNGLNGGGIQKLQVEDDKGQIYAFKREKGNDKVVCIFNLSDKPVKTKLIGSGAEGVYADIYTNIPYKITQNMPLELPAWGFLILDKVKY
jgi:glycosidase